MNQKDKVVEEVKKEVGQKAVDAINKDPLLEFNITTSQEEEEKAAEEGKPAAITSDIEDIHAIAKPPSLEKIMEETKRAIVSKKLNKKNIKPKGKKIPKTP